MENSNTKIYRPYLPVEDLEVTKLLKENWLQIRAESDAMFDETPVDSKPNWVFHPDRNRLAFKGAERMYYGKNISAHLRILPELLVKREQILCAQPGGEERREERRKINPTIMNLLKPWLDKGQVGNIGFNRIWPGAKISAHYGCSTRFFRLHIGLHTDPGATFYIDGDEPYSWKDGEAMGFADGHWLHWVEHHGTKPRTILAVDFDKSILPNWEELFPPKKIK